jgi:hypothetical protein
MTKRILLVIFLVLPLLVQAQRRNRYRYEIGFDIGAANFLGELGGANQIGTNGFKDLEFSLTRPAFGVHVRYRKGRFWGYKTAFMYGRLTGDDALTKEPFRYNRNLHFRSNIFELSGQVEFFLTKEKFGHLYRYSSVRGFANIDLQAYLFLGVGGIWFNPKAQFADKWYALQPLGTEGQGLKPGTKKYSRVNVCIPLGIGFKTAVGRRLSVGLELGMRKTFTDYIDDVSTTYYDNSAIVASNGATAGYFADPSRGLIEFPDNIQVTGAGQQRGDSKDDDAYMFAQITFNYKIGKFKRTRSKF